MLLVSGWSRIVPQCGQNAGPVVVDVEAKNSMLCVKLFVLLVLYFSKRMAGSKMSDSHLF